MHTRCANHVDCLQINQLYKNIYDMARDEKKNTQTINYLDPGRNIDPLMKTAPDNRMYQQDDNSPVLLKDDKNLTITI